MTFFKSKIRTAPAARFLSSWTSAKPLMDRPQVCSNSGPVLSCGGESLRLGDKDQTDKYQGAEDRREHGASTTEQGDQGDNGGLGHSSDQASVEPAPKRPKIATSLILWLHGLGDDGGGWCVR